MKVSLSWIQDFTQIDTSIEELVELIGSRLVEVEEVIDWGARYKGIVVAEITAVRPHENADKLQIYDIAIGDGQTRQVVSGDKSLVVGDKIGYIPPGATVPSTFDTAEPFVIQEIRMRGILSEGMMGSAQELCIGADHSKVQVLDTDAEAGTSLAEAYNLNDIVLDIENKSFTHRPDCFGILGIAREIAAIQGKQFESPAWLTAESLETNADAHLPLKIDNQLPHLVPRFTAVTLAGADILPSSLMMQSMLVRMGVRPISSVVDITNYLMLLTGQPLHAYDYDKVKALFDEGQTPELTVRFPRKDEKITLLDGREITPHAEAMMIAAGDHLLCIGGVMGGQATEVDSASTHIILEAASWDMYSIRRTSMQHGIFTEAVTRFAKGQPPSIALPTLGRAIGMLIEATGATLASEVIDVYPKPKEPTVIEVSCSWINHMLGTSLAVDEIVASLQHVECDVQVLDDGDLEVTVPSWRSDLNIVEDVAEEIGRLYGFDNIEPTLPTRSFTPSMPSHRARLVQLTRQFLRDAGANETLTYGFISERLMRQTNQDITRAHRLVNSISPELAYVRTNVLGSLLTKIQPNHKAGVDQLVLFEINKTSEKQIVGEDNLPLEPESLAVVWSAMPKVYSVKAAGAPYYQVKKYLETLATRLNIHGLHYRLASGYLKNSASPWMQARLGMFDENRSAVVLHGDRMIGVIGEPTAQLKKDLKLPDAVAMFECNIQELLQAQSARNHYQPLSRFPQTTQDVCFKVASDQAYADVVMSMTDFLKSQKDVYFDMQPLDIFEPHGQSEHKHVTLRLQLWRSDRTLTTDETNKLLQRLATHMRTTLRAEWI